MMGGWRGGGDAGEEMRASGVDASLGVSLGVSVGGESGWREWVASVGGERRASVGGERTAWAGVGGP